jgi:hypothetical protein
MKGNWIRELNKPSIVFLIATFCFVLITMDFWRSWHKWQNNFSWDVANYYSYLPAYVNNNGSFEFSNPEFIDDYLPRYPGDSLHIPKTTCGLAMMYSPFYALGYKIAYNQKDPLDGFSEAFATTLHWGTILYALLGLLLLRNFLVKFFSEKVTTITLFILFFGTILFYYSLAQPEAPHSNLFFLFSAFLLVNYHWHIKQGLGRSILLGLLIGLIALIRPTDIMVVFLSIFWPVNGVSGVKEKFLFLMRHYKHILVMILCAFLVWLPQMLFWKARTGHFLYFSYPGERFFWGDPQIINVLFSYRKGLLLYTPLIGLAFAGFFMKYKELKLINRVTAGMLLLNLYLVSCWWDWFFGGCFGARAFVQHFAYLAIPLAILVARVYEGEKESNRTLLTRFAFTIIVSFGVSLNLFQTYQYNNNMIHFSSMTKKTYWLVFGKSALSEEQRGAWWGTLKEPDYEKLRSGEDRSQ